MKICVINVLLRPKFLVVGANIKVIGAVLTKPVRKLSEYLDESEVVGCTKLELHLI